MKKEDFLWEMLLDLGTELVAAVVGWDNYWVYFR